MPLHEKTPVAPGLGRAPEGLRQLDAILHVELAVLYFPFRQKTPYWQRFCFERLDYLQVQL
jgi:hypothetical protein